MIIEDEFEGLCQSNYVEITFACGVTSRIAVLAFKIRNDPPKGKVFPQAEIERAVANAFELDDYSPYIKKRVPYDTTIGEWLQKKADKIDSFLTGEPPITSRG